MKIRNRIDDAHRKHVRSLPCSACGVPAPSEAAHCRLSTFEGVVVPVHQRGGTGLKPADRWLVPLCRGCHAEQHNGGERSFWEARGINPLALCMALWRNTGNRQACKGIIFRACDGSVL